MRIILASLILSVFYTGAALAQVYVANQGSNTVTLIGNPNITIEVDGSPTALAATPDGSFVYVANQNGTVSVIQTSDNTVVATVDVGSEPFGVAVTPDGSHAYVTNSDDGTVSVIQTSDNTVVDTVDVGNSPTGIAANMEGTMVFVANTGSDTVSLIRTSDNTVVKTTNVGECPTDVATSNFPGAVGFVAFISNTCSNTVTSLNSSGNITGVTGVGDTPIGIGAFNPGFGADLDLAIVANQGSNTVSVINPFSAEVISTTPNVGGSPTGLAVDPEGLLAYVTNKDSNTVTSLSQLGDMQPTVFETFDVGDTPVAVTVAALITLGDPDGGGNGSSSNSCALASPGAAPSFPLYLLIPAFILINRFWRRRTS